MIIEVLLSSGETDTWRGADDALMEQNGLLSILEKLVPGPSSPTDEQLKEMKVIYIRSQEDQGPDLPPAELNTPYLLRAVYAPGMWMKVVYQ